CSSVGRGDSTMGFDYHAIRTESDIHVDHLNDLISAGWELYNVQPPPTRGPWSFEFRRRQLPAAATPAPAAPARGGIDGTRPRVGDLIGKFADAAPIPLRRRS